MRTYDLRIYDANEHCVAYFDNLEEDAMLTVLRNIVVLSGFFIDVKINLK